MPIEPGDSWFSPKGIEVPPHIESPVGVARWIGEGACRLPTRTKRRSPRGEMWE